jgi:hypothetical protein
VREDRGPSGRTRVLVGPSQSEGRRKRRVKSVDGGEGGGETPAGKKKGRIGGRERVNRGKVREKMGEEEKKRRGEEEKKRKRKEDERLRESVSHRTSRCSLHRFTELTDPLSTGIHLFSALSTIQIPEYLGYRLLV